MAAHLRYEIDMLRQVVRALGESKSEMPQWLVNALLESFVVHFRSLADVFYPGTNVKADDVLASDFFNDPAEWERVRPALSGEFETARARANKEIAHLTYARLSVRAEEKAWGVSLLMAELEEVISRFYASVPRGKLQ